MGNHEMYALGVSLLHVLMMSGCHGNHDFESVASSVLLSMVVPYKFLLQFCVITFWNFQ